MSSGSSDYARRKNYPEKVDQLISMIQESNSWDSHSKTDALTYVTSGGWISRRSGRGIAGNALRYKETKEAGNIQFQLINPTSDWKEWLKTAETSNIEYSVQQTETGTVITASETAFKQHPSDGKFFRQALRKAAYCVGCRVCETNCKGGHKKAGLEFKYIHVMEIGERGARHHHLVVNHIDVAILQKCWNKAYDKHSEIKAYKLDDTGNYAKLASYLIKYTDKHRKKEDGALQKKRWSRSKNLKVPEPQIEVISERSTFQTKPKAIKGYYVDKDSVRCGTHSPEYYGYGFVRYILVKLE